VDAISLGLQTIQRAEQRLDAAARRVAEGPLEPEDAVELKRAERESETGIAVIRVADRVAGTLLDLLA